MSVSNVRPVDAGNDWRAAEVAALTSQLAQLDVWLLTLAEIETMLLEEDDAGHNARALAASLRCCVNTRDRRVQILRAAIHELDMEARARA